MEKELKNIKKWGNAFIALLIIGGIIEFFVGLNIEESVWSVIGLVTLVSTIIYYYVLYVIIAKIKSQNIIIEQNKEIIKLLSK